VPAGDAGILYLFSKEVIRYFTETEFARPWIEPSLAKDKKSQEAVLTNYIPVENYLIMLDEGAKWGV